MDWSRKEVELIVNDYFEMLRDELTHQSYNKSEHRKKLLPLLVNRSESAIEKKHQNISAVLLEIQVPFINGYKPLSGYQQILKDQIVQYLKVNKSEFEQLFDFFTKEKPILKSNNKIDFNKIVIDGPIISELQEDQLTFRPVKINYLEREQNNRALGEEGERLILEYEKWRLIKEGKENLAEQIKWISKEQGDGTGFDILSKNTNGTDRYIEVKTTKLSKETPIFLTNNEYRFAASKNKNFFLYRVFNFNKHTQFFQRNGSYDNYSILKPQTYKAYIT